MADGTFAVLMLLAGLADMKMNHCGTDGGCLGAGSVTPRIALSLGEVIARRATPATEAYLRYDLGRTIGPFGLAAGLSIAEGGETWVGFGNTYTAQLGPRAYVQLHAMPGFYADNGGFDLGGPIEFRSGIELGYQTRQGWRLGISYDHRSNAGIYRTNPGIETAAFRISVPLAK